MMFHVFELRFVTLMLVVLSQIILSLLSAANVVVANLTGSFAALPIFIIATNASMGLAIMVIIILDYMRRSPLTVLSEVILCAAAGGIDLISAITTLFFKMSDAICEVRSASDLWNTCAAHFAVVTLLWTSSFLLFAYTIGLFYAARRHDTLHPLDKGSVWKHAVRGAHWIRQTHSLNNPPGRRLRKKAPLDIESLRRVVLDQDSHILSRQMGSVSSNSLPATPSRAVPRPPGPNSPTVGFAERMGYFRRDAQGEYVASTPTLPREFLQGNSHRVSLKEVGHGAVFSIQSPVVPRRPSIPDLPNPFPPQPSFSNPILPTQRTAGLVSRLRTSSNSSGNSSASGSGFAGIGTGPSSQKDVPSVSIPVPLILAHNRSSGPPSARSVKPPRSSALSVGGQQRPFRVSALTTPASAHPITLPRLSFQSSRSPNTPTSSEFRQAGARPGHHHTHQPAHSHPSLAGTVSTVSALEAGYEPNPLASPQTRPRAGSASAQKAIVRTAFSQASSAMIPPAAMSPSTKQRVSNLAYPFPLPPLSTYPIKSVAMSSGLQVPVSQAQSASNPFLTGGTAHAQADEQVTKGRPLSTVSTVSFYSTSSASHGPQPPRESLPSTSLLSFSTGDASAPAQSSNSASSRRSSRPKVHRIARVPSYHGAVTQNFWGGTGNGPARRSLASQFQRPQVHPVPQNGN